MLRRRGFASALVLFVAASFFVSPTRAAQPTESPKIDEFLVRFKREPGTAMPAPISGAQRALNTSTRVGESLAHVRSTKDGDDIMRAGQKMTRAQAWELATRIVQQGGAEYAQPVDPDFDKRPPAKPPVGAKP